MPSEAGEKLQKEMNKTLNNIEKSFLRSMRAKMFRCSADCCDDSTLTPERVERCVESCNVHVRQAEMFIEGELNNLQDRLSRCHMACNDKVRDKIGVTPTQNEIERFRNELNICADECAESHMFLISQIYKKTGEFLSKRDLEPM